MNLGRRISADISVTIKDTFKEKFKKELGKVIKRPYARTVYHISNPIFYRIEDVFMRYGERDLTFNLIIQALNL